jgi:hypothetical protein
MRHKCMCLSSSCFEVPSAGKLVSSVLSLRAASMLISRREMKAHQCTCCRRLRGPVFALEFEFAWQLELLRIAQRGSEHMTAKEPCCPEPCNS